jgi:internalin A
MKHIILYVALILSWLCLPLMAADKKLEIVPNGPQAKAAIEKEIRFRLNKVTGTLTEADLGKVTALDLNRKKISDVGDLKRLKQVKWLWLNGNQIHDISALRELREITSLHLESNRLVDTDGLKELRQLKELSINHNQLRDLSALKDLTQLRYLDLGHNQLTDLSALKDLKLLNHLDLRNNPDLPNAEVSKIRAALPKCRIYSNPTK